MTNLISIDVVNKLPAGATILRAEQTEDPFQDNKMVDAIRVTWMDPTGARTAHFALSDGKYLGDTFPFTYPFHV